MHTTTMPMTDAAPSASLLHLLHLVSPALPVGAYAYSQGFEAAVDLGWVSDEAGARDWIANLMTLNLGYLDLPVLLRLYRAWQKDEETQVEYWNRYLQAARESRELLQEDVQMGAALQRLLAELGVPAAMRWPAESATGFAAQFALAGVHWGVGEAELLQGFVWSWLENQVAAAIKLVPLGQTQAQKLLLNLMPAIAPIVERARCLPDATIGASMPRLALASMAHECQYSRLFRS